MNVKFSFDNSFKSRTEKSFKEGQTYVDTQVIEKMTEFVPVASDRYENTGMLRDSVKNPEPGLITYDTPFARHQYYDELNHQDSGNPNATRLWLEVTKEKYGDEIHRGLMEILNKR